MLTLFPEKIPVRLGWQWIGRLQNFERPPALWQQKRGPHCKVGGACNQSRCCWNQLCCAGCICKLFSIASILFAKKSRNAELFSSATPRKNRLSALENSPSTA